MRTIISEDVMPPRRILGALTGLFFLIQSHPFLAQAASFDCKKAMATAEKMICSNASLSQLDEELAKVYLETLAAVPDRALLKRAQRAWVKNNRNQCTSVDCLASVYRARISGLSKELTSRERTSMAGEISGIWQELKPAAGGSAQVIIKKGRLHLSFCKKRIFDLKTINGNQYIFNARENGKCVGYLFNEELNVIKLSLTDTETIHAVFYSGNNEQDWIGSDNFYRIGE